jgi:S1-C subfamily serine protease
VIISLAPLMCFGLDLLGESNEFKNLLEYEKNTINIFQESANSVVNITIEKTVKLKNFWYQGIGEEKKYEMGAGSGFVWDKEGHIVTNTHVVSSGDTFWVTFHKNKKKYKAKLIGKHQQKDLAVLKLEDRPGKLIPIKLGTSKDLLVGQKAIAIGNPLGLDHTMTTGIISALGRVIPGFGGVEIQGVIQTDAAINQGNSGGPLLDSQGRLIGINTMIFSLSGSSSGLGFAVPADTIGRIIPELIKHGKITRPGLGVGIGENPYGEKGLIITYIYPNGGAAQAGLRGIVHDQWGRPYIGDILLEVNGQEINSYNDIYLVLEKHKIGEKVEITYSREDKIKKVKVELTPLSD